jgi:hypothetical protein
LKSYSEEEEKKDINMNRKNKWNHLPERQEYQK